MERSNTEGAQLRNLSEEMRTANASIAPEFTRLHAREAQQHQMLLPSEVAAVIQEVTGEPGCHNDPRLLRRARSNSRFVRQKMKIGHEALALRPACVFGVFFVKRRKKTLRLIVDCREANVWFAPDPSVELPSGDGLWRIEVDTPGPLTASVWACTTVALTVLTSQTDFTGCVSGWRHSQVFLLANGVEQVFQDRRGRR